MEDYSRIQIMNKMTILTAGDIHISDINPKSRTDNFKETILGKIEQLKGLAYTEKADAVLLVGDIFNLKNPTKNSHNLTRELIEIFRMFPCPIYGIPGNHDLTSDSLDTIEQQPISVLFASRAVINLSHEFLIKGTLKVSLVGIPFIKHLEIPEIVMPEKKDADVQICVMHVYASKNSGKIFKEKLYGYDELSVMGSNIFVLGHYHVDQGIEWLDKKCFINLGSISRGSLSDENIQHIPKFGIIKITKKDNSEIDYEINSVPIKIKPAEEVFDLKKRQNEKQQGAEIEKYVELLVTEASSNNIKKISIADHLLNVEKEVANLVLDLIREASTKG